MKLKLFPMRKLQKMSLILLFTIYGVFSFAQIDSVTVNLHFETGTDPGDSSLTIDVLHVDASIYDIDFMGEVIVTVYDATAGFPMGRIKMTAQEFTDQNLLNGDIVTIKLYGLDPVVPYRTETHVRNYQGANSPVISTDYNN